MTALLAVLVSFVVAVTKAQTQPASYDSRSTGAVSSVKNQGVCGSQYAFAAAAAAEGAYFQKYRKAVDVSAQQCVDCVKRSNSGLGCNGGFYQECWAAGANLVTSECYPYTSGQSGQGGTCKKTNCGTQISVASVVQVASKDEVALAKAVVQNGAVACSMNAASFMNYQSGVFGGCSPNDNDPNHAVAIVGYGTTNDGTDYWIVKNSFGTDWGMKGYALLKRGVNMCGISENCKYPVLK